MIGKGAARCAPTITVYIGPYINTQDDYFSIGFKTTVVPARPISV
jgi:hypothetical protein